jgi:putative ABC transport system permease protein
MRLHDLRIGWRQLVADPGTSAVVLVGLAVAIACCCLMAQFVFNRSLVDAHAPDADRLVALEFRTNIPGRHDGWEAGMPIVFGPALRAAGAPVDAVARVVSNDVDVRVGDRLASLKFAFSDPDLVTLFGLRALAGDVAEALRRPDAIALTTTSALRLFGRMDVVGSTLRVHGHLLTVRAVLRAPEPAEILQFEALASIDSPADTLSERMRNAWYNYTGQVYARLAPGHDADELGHVAQAVFDRSPGLRKLPPAWIAGGRQAASVRAIVLARKWRTDADSPRRLGELAAVGVSALLVLALAIVNVVNLGAVRTQARQREIALRKALGAGPRRLILQFMLEAALVAAVAAVLGLLLAWLLAPVVGELLDVPLAAGLMSPVRLLGVAVAVPLIGALAGLHPARIAVGVRCAEALGGRTRDEGRVARRLRRVVTALQFAVALVLAGAATALAWQNHYVETLPRGFRDDGLLLAKLPDGVWGELPRAFHAALARAPEVTGLAWQVDALAARDIQVDDFLRGERRTSMRVNSVEPTFFGVYGIVPIAGDLRSMTESAWRNADSQAPTPVVIDELASRALGFDSPQDAIGQSFTNGENEPMRVIAVVPHLRQEDARGVPQPQFFGMPEFDGRTLVVRGPDPRALRRAVDAAWRQYFPNDVARVERVTDSLARATHADRALGQLIAAASLLSLLLSAFGVYALAACTVRRKAREIVIRKLHGGGAASVVALLGREFAPLLGAGVLVGLPLAGWLVQAWLAGFVERTPAAFWALPIALGVVLAMTALAGLRHASIALRMRPVTALRE